MDFMEKALKDVEELEPIAESIYQAVKNLDDVQISMILGPVIDRWASNHNKVAGRNVSDSGAACGSSEVGL